MDYKPLTKWDVLPSGEPGGCFSPSSGSTLRVFYGRCKGRCLIRVLTLVCGILPVNFCIKWLLWNLDMRFDCAGSHKVCGAVLVWGIFTCKLPYRVALVKCWHAFRLRRLAQSVCSQSGPRQFSCVFPCKVDNVAPLMTLATCGHAFRLRRLAQSVCPCSAAVVL